ncbi:N-myristoyl transferase [Russula earlei]|uniref:N-myristoyl transferase n=1 Tax=Russula earlei TaxID=71964 RepID=A0ACC0TYV2_9AGAM|nr:N-myristoyl transferase [Russula earlei]
MFAYQLTLHDKRNALLPLLPARRSDSVIGQRTQHTSEVEPGEDDHSVPESHAEEMPAAVPSEPRDSVHQTVAHQFVAKVKEEYGEASPAASTDKETVREVLRQVYPKGVAEGKVGLGGKNRKVIRDHKFWATQHVPHYDDGNPEEDGFIGVRQDPFLLPKDSEWAIIDILDTAQLEEVYKLLSANYVEDEQAGFRFQYTAEFLQWELHLGVPVSSNKELVAFVSGVPINLFERNLRVVEINFLCVHKKLRSKRLTPLLIKQIARQCQLTAGVVLPTSTSTCRCYHRNLNVAKLVDYKVPSTISLSSTGLREMEERYVVAVTKPFKRYMERLYMIPLLEKENIRHPFLSGRGKGEKAASTGRRPGQVVWTNVSESRVITDFFSFYIMSSTIVHDTTRHDLLGAACLYYYASDTAFVERSDELGLSKRRLTELVGDAIIMADQAKFYVFNALVLIDNPLFLRGLKFGCGNGLLNFYLYNWHSKALAGMNATEDRTAGRDVRVVMF